MRGINKVILIGHVGADPDSRTTHSGQIVVNATLATSERWMDKHTGQAQERTEWHRLVLFAKQAEVYLNYVKKGAKLYVEGRLQTRKWQDAQNIERYSTEIVVDTFQMLDKKPDATVPQAAPAQPAAVIGGYASASQRANPAAPPPPPGYPYTPATAPAQPAAGPVDDYGIPF